MNFWDITGLDTEDLAVAAAGDLCEGKINPLCYLKEKDNLEKLNYVRWCLALGVDYDSIHQKSSDEIKNLYEIECKKKFGDSVPCVVKKQIVLSTLFSYFGAGIHGDYVITHDSFSGEYPTDKEILIKALKEHFKIRFFSTKKSYYKKIEDDMKKEHILKRA